jgi:hypothetical protein
LKETTLQVCLLLIVLFIVVLEDSANAIRNENSMKDIPNGKEEIKHTTHTHTHTHTDIL